MGILISCEQVSFEYTSKPVLSDVTLGVFEGDRIGIVGRNGDGKSTLLSLVSGLLEPDSGRVTMRRGIRVGVLRQSDDLPGDSTVGQCVVGDLPTHEWAGDQNIRAIVAALLGDVAWDAPIATLSGGQRRRVDLARLLIGQWDVLALDEPTNHLDMRAITWLAEHLKARWPAGEGALLVVTHDRWFLDEVCLSMWEVHDRGVEPFEGGYSAYIEQRVERERLRRVAEERRQNILRKELAWLARGPQARSTKPKFRVEAAERLIADVPEVRNDLELRRLAVSRLGKQVIELKGVTVRLGDKTVLDNVDWIVGPGDRYGILGANGAGKTTLLNVIAGALTPTRGQVRIGQTVKMATLTQRFDELQEFRGMTVREVLDSLRHRCVVDGKETTPAQLLERLGFESGQFLTRVEELSGGQQRRLQLMLVLLDEPNVLILDEPGNDMDTDMLSELEDLLDSWPGTLLLVSHDRYLMERVTDHQFMVLDGKVTHVPGGVEEFLEILDEHDRRLARQGSTGSRHSAAAIPGSAPRAAEAAPASAAPSASAEGYRLRKQIQSLERKMQTQRGHLAELREKMGAVEPSDFVELGRLQAEVNTTTATLDDLETEWLELSEQLDE